MGNLDFTNHAGFSWYCLLLMGSGVAMLLIGVVRGQTRGAQIANLIFGAGFLGYGFYLTFFFGGGTYFVFFKAFILPVVLIASSVRSILAHRRLASARAGAGASAASAASGGSIGVPPQ